MTTKNFPADLEIGTRLEIDAFRAVQDFILEQHLDFDDLGWLSDPDTAGNVGTHRDPLTDMFVPEGSTRWGWYCEEPNN